MRSGLGPRAHLEALGDIIGDPSLVVCLDAECNDYERVWCTTSLRGLTGGPVLVGRSEVACDYELAARLVEFAERETGTTLPV